MPKAAVKSKARAAAAPTSVGFCTKTVYNDHKETPMPAKILLLLQSRKFWALISALAVIICGVIWGGLPISTAIQSAVAAIAAYMIGTGLDVNTNGQPPALKLK